MKCLAMAFTVAMVGCGPSEPANSIRGKITFKGDGVEGTVTFIGPGNKEVTSPVTGGMYSIVEPAVGNHKIKIVGMGGIGVPVETKPPPDKKLPEMASMPSAGKGIGVPPPKKYSNPDNGLTYEFKGGKQTKDFELEP